MAFVVPSLLVGVMIDHLTWTTPMYKYDYRYIHLQANISTHTHTHTHTRTRGTHRTVLLCFVVLQIVVTFRVARVCPGARISIHIISRKCIVHGIGIIFMYLQRSTCHLLSTTIHRCFGAFLEGATRRVTSPAGPCFSGLGSGPGCRTPWRTATAQRGRPSCSPRPFVSSPFTWNNPRSPGLRMVGMAGCWQIC